MDFQHPGFSILGIPIIVLLLLLFHMESLEFFEEFCFGHSLIRDSGLLPIGLHSICGLTADKMHRCSDMAASELLRFKNNDCYMG